MEVKCGSCIYPEERPVVACPWLYKGVPPEGAKLAKLKWVGDGNYYDYIVECPLYEPRKRRRKWDW